METVYKGTDAPITIELFDDDAMTEVVDIDALNELIIIAAVGSVEVQRFSKGVVADHTQLKRTNAYLYYTWIESSSSSPTGMVDLWIFLNTTEADLSDSLDDSVVKVPGLFYLKPPKTTK